MSEQNEVFQISWEGIDITVTYRKNYFKNGGVSLLDIQSKDNQPLPFSETGYKSQWVIEADLINLTPAQLVLNALEADSNTKKWKNYLEKKKEMEIQATQLSLF